MLLAIDVTAKSLVDNSVENLRLRDMLQNLSFLDETGYGSSLFPFPKNIIPIIYHIKREKSFNFR